MNLIPIIINFFLYKLKIKGKKEFKDYFFKFVKKINVNEYVNDFWEKNDYKIKKFYIKKHKFTDIIISASPEFLLLPVAKKYKFKLIATKYDLNNYKILGENCYGNEKVRRLKEFGIVKCQEFYSDSKSDEPCARIAKRAFLVKKEKIIEWKI